MPDPIVNRQRVSSLIDSTVPAVPAADREAAVTALDEAARTLGRGDIPSVEGTSYGEQWNQDVNYTLPWEVRRNIAACGAVILLAFGVGSVRRVRRRSRELLRKRWGDAALAMGLQPPESAA
jgi:hypothetical protein